MIKVLFSLLIRLTPPGKDARVMFHAVRLGILPIVSRRLDSEERQRISSGDDSTFGFLLLITYLSSGDVYIWEVRCRAFSARPY
jgi:hypothetical protein